MNSVILIRGGGDLASGVALRLHRAGFGVAITEIPQPLAVRRLVSFAEAVYRGVFSVEGVGARRVAGVESAPQILARGAIPVFVDPPADIRHELHPAVLVDARMTKKPPDLGMDAAPLVIGLGPGFIPGENCHAAIETRRGHTLGRALWDAPPDPDTGTPEGVGGRGFERVLRAPANGTLAARAEIGDRLQPGQLIAEVAGEPVRAPFRGVLRGLLHPGLIVRTGMKIGDLDPRNDPRHCTLVSDKALAIGGGVLEAILSRADLRPWLWG
ncbi:MAG: selenium-dependent molybdenum cofactor biosynthesis protein YqeB [Anaerolineales bacterium]